MDFSILNHTSLDSTNNIARRMAEEGANEGTVVVAEEQTAGRGRKGDPWISLKGGLWFTLILKPDASPQKSLLLPLLMGLSVHRAVKRFDVSSNIKLPNDVMVERKKLCGILCENRIQGDRIRYVLAGVGVNVLNDPPDMGISLSRLVDPCPAPHELLRSILLEFEIEYLQFITEEYYFGEGYEKQP